MSPRKIAGITFVVLFHALIGYAFITGLAYNVIKKAAADLKVVDVKDEPPPPEQKPPPPPPDQKVEPPPIVAPPPIVQTQTIAPPTIQSVPVAPPPAPPVIHETAPPAPPPPKPVALSLKGSLQTLMSADDYPQSAIRNQESGTVGFHLTIGSDGHVNGCSVTQSSGHQDLDDTACRLLTRRARFVPGKDSSGNATGGVYDSRFRWELPKE